MTAASVEKLSNVGYGTKEPNLFTDLSFAPGPSNVVQAPGTFVADGAGAEQQPSEVQGSATGLFPVATSSVASVTSTGYERLDDIFLAKLP